MKTFDDNWHALKNEDFSIPDAQPYSMLNAEDIKLVQWSNNLNNQKLSWRDRMTPYTAWIDKGDTKGLWRPIENRLYDEIQTDYVLNHYGKGYRIIRSTARFENGEAMLNVKLIEIQQYENILETLLILDGNRVMIGKPYKIRGGLGWKFNDSVRFNKVLPGY